MNMPQSCRYHETPSISRFGHYEGEPSHDCYPRLRERQKLLLVLAIALLIKLDSNENWLKNYAPNPS